MRRHPAGQMRENSEMPDLGSPRLRLSAGQGGGATNACAAAAGDCRDHRKDSSGVALTGKLASPCRFQICAGSSNAMSRLAAQRP